jgi:dihydropteroate synthase
MSAELRWGERTYLMGIVNLTADSFSGDGLAAPGRSTEEIVTAAT